MKKKIEEKIIIAGLVASSAVVVSANEINISDQTNKSFYNETIKKRKELAQALINYELLKEDDAYNYVLELDDKSVDLILEPIQKKKLLVGKGIQSIIIGKIIETLNKEK